MIYEVEITETLSRVIEIDAPSADEAEEAARAMYENEDIVLNSNDMLEGEDIRVINR